MLIERIFDIISKYHHYKISLYAKKLGCDTLIDVGSHKGEFLSSFLKINIFKKFYYFEPQKKIKKKNLKITKKLNCITIRLGKMRARKKFIYQI